jgi:hypothetical protein
VPHTAEAAERLRGQDPARLAVPAPSSQPGKQAPPAMAGPGGRNGASAAWSAASESTAPTPRPPAGAHWQAVVHTNAKLSPSSSRAREREVPRPPALALAGHGVLARRPPSGCWAGWGRSAVCSASETRHRRTAPRRPTYALSNALGCPSESHPRCPPQSYGTARPS